MFNKLKCFVLCFLILTSSVSLNASQINESELYFYPFGYFADYLEYNSWEWFLLRGHPVTSVAARESIDYPSNTTHMKLFASRWDYEYNLSSLETALKLQYLCINTFKPPFEGAEIYPGWGKATNIFNLPELVNLKALDLQNAHILYPQELAYTTRQFWDKMAAFPNLEYLDVTGNPDLNFEGIERLNKLKTLLTWVVNDQDLEHISNVSTLEMLGIYFLNVKSLDLLGNLENLRGLSLTSNDADLLPIAKLPNLQLLEMHEPKGFKSLGESKSITALNIFGKINCEAIQEILKLKQLESLMFGYECELSMLLPILQSDDLINLHMIDVGSIALDRTLKFHQKIDQLERVVLVSYLQDELESSIIQIPGLNKLKFLFTRSINFSFLSNLLELEELDLSNQDLDAWQLEQLSTAILPTLNVLDLSNIKSRGLPFDQMAPELQELKLAGSNVSGGDIKKIASLHNLTELDLSNTGVSYTAVLHLSKTDSPISKLDLSYNNLKGANFGLLKALPTLKELNLRRVSISKSDFDTLKELDGLETLDLRDLPNINITENQIEELRQALPNCIILG